MPFWKSKTLAFDILALIALYFVEYNVAWRNAYARSEGLLPSTGYAPFLKYFLIEGASVPLRSPPTLDWVQVLLVSLVVVNAFYFYEWWTAPAPRRPRS